MTDPIPAPSLELIAELELELDGLINQVLDLLERGAAVGVELDPLQAILACLKERGESIDLETAPPMLRMLLGGMIG